MRNKLKRLIAFALAVILVGGMAKLPAKEAEAGNEKPEFTVRFTDLSGNPVTEVTPGSDVIAVFGVKNADKMTGFSARLYYNKTVDETETDKLYTYYAKEVSDFAEYDEKITEGEFVPGTGVVGGTADSTGLAINFETKPEYVRMDYVATNKNEDTITPGLGDMDICSIYMKAGKDAIGEFPFEVELIAYQEDGMGKNINVGSKDEKACLSVKREPKPMTGFELNETSLKLDLSDENPEAQLEVASYEPEDTTDTDKTVEWKVIEGDAVTVSESGLVTAVKKGTATVEATIESSNGQTLKRQCTITVSKSVTSVSLDQKEITLAKDQTRKLVAVVAPSDADDSEISWESSDPNVVEVDPNGVVKALVENGSAVITASTKNGKNDTCYVEVKTRHLNDIELSNDTLEIPKEDEKELTVTFDPDLANVTDDVTEVDWEVKDPGIASISKIDGFDHNEKITVTGLQSGETVIKATVESNGQRFVKECDVKVYVPLEKLGVDHLNIGTDIYPFLKGETEIISAVLSPGDADTYKLTWSVDSEGIIEISPSNNGESCKILALKAGEVNVTVKDEISGKTAVTKVKVTETPIQSIQISVDNPVMNKGEKQIATATVLPSNTTDENKSVSWESSAPEIATIDSQTGEIEAVSGGKATIKAVSNARKEVFETIEITVNVPLESISFVEGTETIELKKNTEMTLTVQYIPEDTTVDRKVKWEKQGDLSAVELIDNKNGSATIKAKQAGKVEILASVDGKQVRREITVTEIKLESVVLNIQGTKVVDLKEGAFEISAMLYPSDMTDKIVSVEWSSSETTVATVSGTADKAEVSPIRAGETTIGVKVTTDDNRTFEDSCTIKVVIPMTDIAITKDGADVTGSTLTVVKNQGITLGYHAVPLDTTDHISRVEWSSSDSEFVTVTQKDDTATIKTVKESKEPVEVVLTVYPDTGEPFVSSVYISAQEIHIESISLSEENITLESYISEKRQLHVQYSPDNTTDDKTINWSSSDANVATVDQSGMVTAVGGGQAKISATTVNGKTAYCEVKVPIHISEVVSNDLSLMRNESQQIEASVLPEITDDDSTLEYRIDETRGTPDSIALEGNTVTGVKAGKAYIVVTAVNAYGDPKPETTVEVTVSEKELQSITVTSVGIKDENGVYQIRFDEKNPSLNVQWPDDVTDNVRVEYQVLEGQDVVNVDSDGNLTFFKDGPATIKVKAIATDGAGFENVIETECKLYVNIIPLESIDFKTDCKDVVLKTGEEKLLTIVYNPADTTDKELYWNVSDPSVVEILHISDGEVLVKALAIGNATITAESSGGLKAETMVTVKEEAGISGGHGENSASVNSPKDKSDIKGAVKTSDIAKPGLFGVFSIVSLFVIIFVAKRKFNIHK